MRRSRRSKRARGIGSAFVAPDVDPDSVVLAHSGLKASRVERPTRLIDSAPTILDVLGVTYEKLPGKSLFD